LDKPFHGDLPKTFFELLKLVALPVSGELKKGAITVIADGTPVDEGPILILSRFSIYNFLG
jgi:hypothetical protein